MNTIIIGLILLFFVLTVSRPAKKVVKKLTCKENYEVVDKKCVKSKHIPNVFELSVAGCPRGYVPDPNNADRCISDKNPEEEVFPRLSYSFKTGSPELAAHLAQRNNIGLDTTCVEHTTNNGNSFTVCYDTVDLSNYKSVVKPNGMPFGTMQYRVDLVKNKHVSKECKLNEILSNGNCYINNCPKGYEPDYNGNACIL
jgi:hypothetical protein